MNTISKPSVDLHREEEPHLARNLSNRHLQLIAIGGTIGTGLFMGSGKAVSLAGPSILLIYAITGFMLFFVMRALGEILLSNLQYRSFADFAGDYLGPCAQFFTGWTYWLCWIVTAVAEVVAVPGYVSFWFPHLAPWIPALGLITILLILNLPTVRNFGEIEFWFALIKIITIIGLIITGIYMLTHDGLCLAQWHPGINCPSVEPWRVLPQWFSWLYRRVPDIGFCFRRYRTRGHGCCGGRKPDAKPAEGDQ